MDYLIPILIADGVICGFIGAVIGNSKNSSGGGFLLGFLLGPLGVIAAFALDGRAACPTCGGKLNGTPTVCQHCQQPLTHAPSPQGKSFQPRPIQIRCTTCGGKYDMPRSQYAKLKGQFVECPFCQEGFEL